MGRYRASDSVSAVIRRIPWSSRSHLSLQLRYDDCDPVSLSCNSISFFKSPFLLPQASDFTHTFFMSFGVCLLWYGRMLYEKVGFFPPVLVVTAEAPSRVSSEGVLMGRGQTRSKASGSPHRLFPIDFGPMATCFQWFGRSHLKKGPSVGMQAAIRAK